MKRSHRIAHRLLWPIILIVAALFLYLAWSNKPQIPANPALPGAEQQDHIP